MTIRVTPKELDIHDDWSIENYGELGTFQLQFDPTEKEKSFTVIIKARDSRTSAAPTPFRPINSLTNSQTNSSADKAVRGSLIKADQLEEANGELAFTIEDPVNTILGSKKRSRLRVFDSTDRACSDETKRTEVTQGLVTTSCLPDVEI